VHDIISKEELHKRFRQINDFEYMLWEEGATILKFFLHIDSDEQKKRLLERLRAPKKQWKFNEADVTERKLWPAYMKVYEQMLGRTSTDYAPWYIVPANKKWYRNVVVAQVIVEALKGLNMKIPKPKEDLSKLIIK
jgi:polyphosphate kinase 2 (PPK2 family)